jgi:hypothetical protein
MGTAYARVGLLIGIGFGALWAAWAMALLSLGRAGMTVIAAAPTALAAAAVSRPLVFRGPPRGTAGPRRTWLWYSLIVVAEIVALNLLFVLIEARGWQEYRPPAIGLIVGLHFLPLGRAMRFSGFRLLGTAMTAAAVAAIVAIALGADPRLAAGLDCLVNALMLWGSAAIALLPRRS